MINRAKNIKYNAAEGVTVTDSMKVAMQNNIAMWFAPFKEEINSKDGIFIVYYHAIVNNTVTLSVSDQSLYTMAIAHARETFEDFR